MLFQMEVRMAVFSTQNTTNDTFGTDYSLEYLLNQFNVVSFGNVEMNETHCMGAVLIQGKLFRKWIQDFLIQLM